MWLAPSRRDTVSAMPGPVQSTLNPPRGLLTVASVQFSSAS